MKYCPSCKKMVQEKKKPIHHGCLGWIILALFFILTGGAGLIIYALSRIIYIRTKVCPICGCKVINRPIMYKNTR